MGDVQHHEEVGKFLTDSLPSQSQVMQADDQSSLVYLMSTGMRLWSPKTYIENDIYFTEDWIFVTEKLEEMEQYGYGNSQRPIMTHFTGCSYYGGREGAWPWDQCKWEMERAMDFTDN